MLVESKEKPRNRQNDSIQRDRSVLHDERGAEQEHLRIEKDALHPAKAARYETEHFRVDERQHGTGRGKQKGN